MITGRKPVNKGDDDPLNILKPNSNIVDFRHNRLFLFFTAVEIQESYGYALNVNFLAAGANNPSVGSGGKKISILTNTPIFPLFV